MSVAQHLKKIRWDNTQISKVALFGLTLGCFATFSQVILFRETLAVCGQNELVLAIGFALWLTSVGLGSFVANNTGEGPAGLIGGGIGGWLAAPVGLCCLRLHRWFVHVPTGGSPSLSEFLISLSMGLVPSGFAVGFLFTGFVRFFGKGSTDIGKRLYVAEAIGALTAGLLFSFVLVSHFNPLGLLFAVGALLNISLWFALVFSTAEAPFMGKNRQTVGIWVLGAFVLTAVVLANLSRPIDKWTHRTAFYLLEGASELMDTKESPYGRWSITTAEGQYRLYRDERLAFVFPDEYDQPVPIHLAMVQHPRPKSALLIDTGAPDCLETALAHNLKQVTLTYLDETSRKIGFPYYRPQTQLLLGDKRVKEVHGDGRRYVHETTERFDVILVNTPIAQSAGTNRYYTKSFFEAVKKRLTPTGTLTVKAHGAANILSPEGALAAAVTHATLKAVFSNVSVSPGQPLLFHAAKQPGILTIDVNTLKRRFRSQTQHRPLKFTHHRLDDIYASMKIDRALAQIQSQRLGADQVNTDLTPRAYLSNLKLWEMQLTDSNPSSSSGIIAFFQKTSWIWYAAVALGFLLFPVLYFIFKKTSTANSNEKERQGFFSGPVGSFKQQPLTAYFSIATTGAAAMGLEILLLYTYQTAKGVLYSDLAALVAVFMAGLALGGHLGRVRLFRPFGFVNQGLWSDLLILLVSLAMLPMLLFAHQWPILIWIGSVLAGVSCGIGFPSCLSQAIGFQQEKSQRTVHHSKKQNCYNGPTEVDIVQNTKHASRNDQKQALDKSATKEAGRIEAFDHIGGAVGALLTGLVWLPIYGIVSCLLLFAGYKALSALVQICHGIKTSENSIRTVE